MTWKAVQLEEVADFIRGVSYKSTELVDEGDGQPLINLKCISKGGGFNPSGIKYFKGPFSPERTVTNGDLVVANTDLTRAANIAGAPLYVENLNAPAVISMDVSKLIPTPQVYKNYLYYRLRANDARNYMKSCASGSTVLHLSIPQAKLYTFDLPPLPEQKAIARVLTTMQDAIAEQERFIEKLKELKRSIMHHLFTHGTKGEKTKMTEIGEIPESWDVVRLGDVCETNSGGTPSRSNKSYYNGDIPWIKSGEMNDGYISDSEEHITKDAVKNSFAKLFEKGTLLIAMYGATAGKTAILEREATTNQAICAIFKNDAVDLEYIRHALVLQRDFLLDQRHGGAQPNLSQTSIRNLLIPFPSISEQQVIANALVAGEAKTYTIQSKLSSYQSLFKTLLHELMSGERRISI